MQISISEMEPNVDSKAEKRQAPSLLVNSSLVTGVPKILDIPDLDK
jgi:hypothetical protein